MSARSKFLLFGSLVLISLNFTCKRGYSQTSTSTNSAGARVYGDAHLTTNNVENGITASAKGPALLLEIGYQWTQFKLGVYGSNVDFPSKSESLNLRPNASYKFIFSDESDMTVKHEISQYYKSGQRNGNNTSVDINFWSYHVVYEKIGNWYGTETESEYINLYKSWDIPWDFKYNLSLGYMITKSEVYSSFFDLRTGVSYKYIDFTYSLDFTSNSKFSQFNSDANLFAIFTASFRF